MGLTCRTCLFGVHLLSEVKVQEECPSVLERQNGGGSQGVRELTATAKPTLSLLMGNW